MKKIGKLKLNQICKAEMDKKTMFFLKGGDDCDPCACACGGSSSSNDNHSANHTYEYSRSGGGGGLCACACCGSEEYLIEYNSDVASV